ncbi:MAG TPA: cytochrome bc complex cytochrome b subunit [Nitriliruptoraceae bacterium]|nr:cytochrome bc complex cytochrome b subunit [Nitriliruptoraceae bacterium]
MSQATSDAKETPLQRVASWADDRLHLAEGSRKYLRKAFPGHWSFLVGEIAMFSLVILLVTGTFLALFYTPDTTLVIYDGPYVPLQGQEITAAYDSTLRLSFEIRAGLLFRQVHHWAALVFVAAIVVHLLRVFFTGSFRRPRELNWVIGGTLLLLAFGAGFTGYSLPDDLLSGTGLRIGYSALLSVPFIGPLLGYLGLGGEYPGAFVLGRLHILHVMILPALLVGVLAVHLVIMVRQKHTQKRRPGATEHNVIGEPLWPNQTITMGALFMFTAAVLSLLGGLFEINAVWLYGPYEPFEVFAPSQPDWYMGWLEGLLRLWPAWEFTILGVTIPSVFIPSVVIPGIMFTVMFLWPWIEVKWISHDTAEHHINQRPRDVPVRTAVGVSSLVLLAVIFVAGSNDVVASDLGIGLQTLTNWLRVMCFVLPAIAWFVTIRMMRRLQAQSVQEPVSSTADDVSSTTDDASASTT